MLGTILRLEAMEARMRLIITRKLEAFSRSMTNPFPRLSLDTTSMNPTPDTQKRTEPSIHEHLDQLEKSNSLTQESLLELNNRLTPILTPEPQQIPQPDKAAFPSSCCPISSKIQSLTNQINSTTQNIKNLINQIEL